MSHMLYEKSILCCHYPASLKAREALFQLGRLRDGKKKSDILPLFSMHLSSSKTPSSTVLFMKEKKRLQTVVKAIFLASEMRGMEENKI